MIERLIILSPGHPEANGRFHDRGSDGTYIGGDIRMQAAVKVVQDQPEVKCILLAGMNVEEVRLDNYDDSCKRYLDDTLRYNLIVNEYFNRNPPLLAPKERQSWGIHRPL